MRSILKTIPLYIRTVLRLGVGNVLLVVLYRLVLKSGFLARLLPVGAPYKGPFFPKAQDILPLNDWPFDKRKVIDEANRLCDQHKISYFSHHILSVGAPPDWFCNPFNGQVMPNVHRHFSRISDFNNSIGDIKTIWEASRFDWLLLLARAFRLTGDRKYIDVINDWTADWIKHNPYCSGPNWKCGQETAIRMLNMLLTAHILGRAAKPSDAMIQFVAEHCSRIRPTIYYAMAQNNNHGTSEATGLFVGGAWLCRYANNRHLESKGARWLNYGRKRLEERVEKLIEDDGSFSQKSLNYHRVLVDTLCLSEFWRNQLDCPRFSDAFYRKARKATEWLYCMTDSISGDAPNLGSNDGARLIQLSSTPYRDYRPSVQLGCVLFFTGFAYSDGPWDEPLFWLNSVKPPAASILSNKETKQFKNGGYTILCGNPKHQTWGLLRHLSSRTHPSHSDIHHLDLWHKGQNILRDGGSYSYAAAPHIRSYFSGSVSHNTIGFDGRNQTRPLRRFLSGSNIKSFHVGDVVVSDRGHSVWSSYKDTESCFHKRAVSISVNKWTIEDEIAGAYKQAVLRWRLMPAKWVIEGNRCCCEDIDIEILSDTAIQRFEIIQGRESRHYFEQTNVPVLEVEVALKQTLLQTVITFKE